MRIIAGTHGGRQIKTPRNYKTRPMSERARQALFNSLTPIEGLKVWDAFAGSGSIAIEAISRGAEFAVATDKDRDAFKVLQENVKKLGLEDKMEIQKTTAKAWSKRNKQAVFDIIICDPPYNDLQLSTVFSLFRHLKAKGLMVLSQSGREPVTTVNGVVVVDNRNYGDASLVTYQHDPKKEIDYKNLELITTVK